MGWYLLKLDFKSSYSNLCRKENVYSTQNSVMMKNVIGIHAYLNVY